MVRLFKVSPDDYEIHWHKHYVAFHGYCQDLPERSLPPIAAVIWLMLDIADGELFSAEDLRKALKMPVEAP